MPGIKERSEPGPTYMTENQMGQHNQLSHSSSAHTPPTNHTQEQVSWPQSASLQYSPTAQYLSDLRKRRSDRPTGSRPPPPSKFNGLKRNEMDPRIKQVVQDHRPRLQTSNSMPVMQSQRASHQRTDSQSTDHSTVTKSSLSRPPSIASYDTSATVMEQPMVRRIPSIPYIERGTRWMEKQEVHSIRQAMEDMNLDDEERMYAAARDEAAELVWKHQNRDAWQAQADAPYANPDVKRDYRSHLRKGSYRRSVSQESNAPMHHHGESEEDQRGSLDIAMPSDKRIMHSARKVTPPNGIVSVQKVRMPSGGQNYNGLAEAVADDIARAHRRSSSGSKRRISSEKKAFMNSHDRIWEDPQEEATPPKKKQVVLESAEPAPPTQPVFVRKNPFARVRMQAEKLERSQSEPIVTAPMRHRVEIQKNPPSQSRNAEYKLNNAIPAVADIQSSSLSHAPSEEVPTKDGKEIRDHEIRAATSKQRKDYSPNLPRPTVVSDKPGRPIVSFKNDWNPPEIVMTEGRTSSDQPKSEAQTAKIKNEAIVASRPSTSPKPTQFNRAPRRNDSEAVNHHIPRISIGDTPSNTRVPPITIPIISLPDEPNFSTPTDRSAPASPTINVEPPSINVRAPPNSPNGSHVPKNRALPTPSRPLPHHSASSPLPKSTPHYTPTILHSGAQCAHCALPIAGRILSAAGERFHPSCFVCHKCNTNLELVAFYPEPEQNRQNRLARIMARQADQDVSIPDRMNLDDLEAADGDPSLRFYCHLDFHELFSPRCKSCKTPIEGEVIVACGAEWHVGHFFCAQCGDPFDSSTPFVEKDGYAWCVGCHTNRYSPKCRKCRKPVIDTVLKALGHDWHAHCFVCSECNGEFTDGRYFLRGDAQVPACVRCEERRLKS